jgi:hemerythrin
MKWKEEYSVGIERIDEQHQMLFKMVGDFRAALDEGHGVRTYGLLLKSLEVYTRNHFEFEECCMEQRKCPAAQQNKDAHQELLDSLAHYKERYTGRGYNQEEAYQLMTSLEEWLDDHICAIDLQLKPCIKGVKP